MKLISITLSALVATGYAENKKKTSSVDVCTPSQDARTCLRDGKIDGARSICRWSNQACVDACTVQASKMRCNITDGCAWNNPALECIRAEPTCAHNDGWIKGCNENTGCQWEGTFSKCCDASDLAGSCPDVFGPVDCTTLALRECRQRDARGECVFDLGSRRNSIPWSCSNVATSAPAVPPTSTYFDGRSSTDAPYAENYTTEWNSYESTEDVSSDDSEWTMSLVGGRGPWEGRVEFSDQYGQTATVCDDYFGLFESTYRGDGNLSNTNGPEVVCRELGYTGGVYRWFGQGSGLIGLDDVQCAGDEDSIMDCEHRGWRVHNCGHPEDAGVRCNEPSK